MQALKTIRVRLLSAFGFVTMTTAFAVFVSFLAFNSILNSVNDTSERLMPESRAVQALAIQVYKITGELNNLASAPTEAAREKSFQEYSQLSNGLEKPFAVLKEKTVDQRIVRDLGATIDRLDAISSQVNTAQASFLRADATRVALLKEAHVLRDALQATLEDAIDDANEMDVETYLRTGLSATAISSLYTELSEAKTKQDIDAIASQITDYADEININFAILGASVPSAVKQGAQAFLEIRDGENGLLAARSTELKAIAIAEQAKKKAEHVKLEVSDQIDLYVANLRQRVETSSIETQARGDHAKMILFIVAALSVGVAIAIGWFYVSGDLLRRISRLSKAMNAVSKGDLDAFGANTKAQDELGEMERALEVFRENALNMERLNREKAEADERAWKEKEAIAKREKEREETERARARAAREAAESERKAMMQRLRAAFGVIIDAAGKGDFSKRVEERFDDEELNDLAHGLNTLAYTVQNGLKETKSVLEAVARYDLSLRVEGNYEGEFAQLKQGVNATADNLTEIVEKLQGTTKDLRSTTNNLLAGANELSNRATEQAAMIEQTSAATELLSRSVTENSKRAGEASQKATEANDMANNGGAIMEEATAAIDRIAVSSSKISEIIGLIESVAFQTNLLSLNASVEAARAGEAGAGFAVVASEVRALAQSTSAASKEIKELIDEGAEDVQKGVDLVSKVADSLTQIVGTVGGVTELMNAIATDNRDQVTNLAEVNGAVRHMDEMIQRNAALSQHTHSAISDANNRFGDIDHIAQGFTVSRKKAQPLKAAS